MLKWPRGRIRADTRLPPKSLAGGSTLERTLIALPDTRRCQIPSGSASVASCPHTNSFTMTTVIHPSFASPLTIILQEMAYLSTRVLTSGHRPTACTIHTKPLVALSCRGPGSGSSSTPQKKKTCNVDKRHQRPSHNLGSVESLARVPQYP